MKDYELLEVLFKGVFALVFGVLALFGLLPLALGMIVIYVVNAVWGVVCPKPKRKIPTPEERQKRKDELVEEGRKAREEEKRERDSEMQRIFEREKLQAQYSTSGVSQKAKEEPKLEDKLYTESSLDEYQKEDLFARKYRRIKISPYGNSGATYFWIKQRYNESKEHAFFCYLVEAEVRKYASEVALHVSDGPDVVFRYQEKEYAIDVETGSNEARNPLMLKQKFKRYEERYYRSFILVTNKKLKYRYSKYGTVLTRSTFRSVLHDALLSNPDTQYNMELAKRRKNKKSSNEESDDAASD